jgi:hypothetical protein
MFRSVRALPVCAIPDIHPCRCPCEYSIEVLGSPEYYRQKKLPVSLGNFAGKQIGSETPTVRTALVVELSKCGTVPSVRSSRPPRSHRSHALRNHGNHGNLGSRAPTRLARRCQRFPYRRDRT